jgi:hypothetical protein
MIALMLLANANANTVERWNQWEVALSGPSDGNPFADVSLSATFTLRQAPLPDAFNHPTGAPEPLVALDFADATGGVNGTVPNSGSSASAHPTAQMMSVGLSPNVPAGSPGNAADLGEDVTYRHVVEIPGDGRPFTGGLAGLRAFTISGWINVRDTNEGPGGNRVLNFCKGGGGIDLVWDGAGGGRLKLSVNEWPDGGHPASAAGSVPVSAAAWPQWRFFAVSYDADAADGDDHVRWYLGDSKRAAARDGGASGGSYDRGAVADPQLPLSFGNFGSGVHIIDNRRICEWTVFATKHAPRSAVIPAHPLRVPRLSRQRPAAARTAVPPRRLRPRAHTGGGRRGARQIRLRPRVRRRYVRLRREAVRFLLRYATPCYAMLCFAVLCCAMLCYAMLCYAMLCYAMLCYAMLCYAMLCCAMPCYAMQCYALLCCAMLCYAMLCNALLC